jgi:hypothetical protein
MKFPRAVALNREELVMVATAMLAGEKDLLEGVREICSLRHAAGDPENKVFHKLRTVDSETDHFPLGDVRSQWLLERLSQLDIEKARYLDEARADILSACKAIIDEFSQPP